MDDNAEINTKSLGDNTEVIVKVLRELDPNERRAVVLRDSLETEYPEIAEILGMDEAQVRHLVTRARGLIADAVSSGE